MIIRDSNFFGTKETDHGRYYYLKNDPNTLFPSVSTVVKGSNKSGGWCSPYAAIGSIVHWRILKCYADRQLPRPTDPIYKMAPDEARRRIEACVAMWDKLQLKIKPICVETALFSDDPRIAGRMDMFCRLDGKRTLLDIKTGKEYKENYTQTSAYVHMLKWAVDQAALVYLDADLTRNPEQLGRVKIIEKGELKEHFDVFRNKYLDFEMPEAI
jgi:hypothetical protein